MERSAMSIAMCYCARASQKVWPR